LLDFAFDTGRTSLSLAYPSRSSSRRFCSASMRCLRVASLRWLAIWWSPWPPMPSSSSSDMDAPRWRRRSDPDDGDGVGL
jgi:hypothetical protein